jgi:hypothetical protein
MMMKSSTGGVLTFSITLLFGAVEEVDMPGIALRRISISKKDFFREPTKLNPTAANTRRITPCKSG